MFCYAYKGQNITVYPINIHKYIYQLKLIKRWPGMLVHTCDPSCSEAEISRITVQDQPGQKVSKAHLNK
jgi:hypothetical protein